VGISAATVVREWTIAKAWLRAELSAWMFPSEAEDLIASAWLCPHKALSARYRKAAPAKAKPFAFDAVYSASRRMTSVCLCGARRRVLSLGCALSIMAAGLLFAQERAAQERRREQWQKVDEIFAAMGVRPGVTVADIGAGDGFFTSRLARAVGPNGRVFAVDIDDRALERLRKRLDEDGIRNVTIVKGATDDPKVPERVLDSALIVNAYHEMDQHQSVLAALRRALKPEGRLVIVEPVRDARRGRPRADQAGDHEIDPEYVLRDARAAGFRILGLQDPFTFHDPDTEWLLTLQPMESAATAPSTIGQPSDREPRDPELTITLEEFRKLAAGGAVTIVDVRDSAVFAAAHVPGAISIPLGTVGRAAEHLRRLGKPIVTYCS
jgi:predicted methyltransferase